LRPRVAAASHQVADLDKVRPELHAVAGSPLWQAVFVSFAIALILFEVVRGWRLGLLRQLVRVAALAAAYAIGFFGGTLLVPIARPFMKMPDIVLSILGGAVLALVVYSLLVSIGAILLKRTGQQNSKLVHLLYAVTGAVIGLFFGAFLLLMVVVSVRGRCGGRRGSPQPGKSCGCRSHHQVGRF
jgi:hypothetical protein